jgi:ankyrin repeat protein
VIATTVHVAPLQACACTLPTPEIFDNLHANYRQHSTNARAGGHSKAVDTLLAAGASPLEVSTTGTSPLMAAVSVNCLEVVESLLAWGEKQATDNSTSTSTSSSSALDVLCAAKDSDGKSAYQLAMDKGFKDIAKLIKVCV